MRAATELGRPSAGRELSVVRGRPGTEREIVNVSRNAAAAGGAGAGGRRSTVKKAYTP
jgi:hypothetical protein